MYRFLSNVYPKKVRKDYVDLLKYSGLKVNSDKFVGFMLVFDLLFSIAMGFFFGAFFDVSWWFSFFGVFVVFQILVYFILLLRADAKARFVEGILPDVLQLMSSNLRAGLTTDKALLLAARPEFGPFQDEINNVGKEITMGKDISTAMIDMAKQIKSERLSKTMALIVSGLKAGGELASLLDQTARNLRQERLVDSRIRANVMMYVIFIFVAVCFGAPLLFGLSSFLVEVLTENLASIELPDTQMGDMPINFSEVSITVDFVIMFSIVFLITSSVLGALILGLISKGREREGIKFMPALIFASLGIFLLIRFTIKALLGGLFGF